MATYYVDDGGSATSPYDTWAKAATSLSALDDAVTLASGDIVYIGHDHVCQYTHSANRNITGPTSGAPCVIISATQGSNPPTYQASTTNQIDTSEGAYNLVFAGRFALYGLRMKAGATLYLQGGADGFIFGQELELLPGAGSSGYVLLSGDNHAKAELRKCVIDHAADASSADQGSILIGGQSVSVHLTGITWRNATFRRESVIEFSGTGYRWLEASGLDVSGFTNGDGCPLLSGGGTLAIANISNVITKASGFEPFTSSAATLGTHYTLTNCGPADDPSGLYTRKLEGGVSSSSVYRTGGAEVEGVATSWKVVTSATCAEGRPFYTPWMHGKISSTGSKTFTVYFAQDGGAGDLTDAEIWLEVEYLGTADEANTSLASNQRTITTTAAAQIDDTASTWTGITATYKQSLAVTVTVNEDGLYRARVAVAKASTTVYVDPKVTVS